jgi:hypothetical protein
MPAGEGLPPPHASVLCSLTSVLRYPREKGCGDGGPRQAAAGSLR